MQHENSDLPELRVQAARACRILAHQGLATGILGHVSVRVGEDQLLVRCRGPRERGLLFTAPEDIRLLDLDGTRDPGDGYAAPKELPLHAEVLRRRPEVASVVHAHPWAVVAADLAGAALRPIVGSFNIPALRLARDGIPVYPRGVLIRRRDLAQEMVAAMGDSPVCLLRAHGLTTVGESVPQAVVRALNVDELARMCLDVARAGGSPADLPEEDVAELPDLGSAFNDTLLWAHHVALLRHARLDV
ncbi:MAG: class II aldolase/adducin family protein [Streptomycetales bacterium]